MLSLAACLVLLIIPASAVSESSVQTVLSASFDEREGDALLKHQLSEDYSFEHYLRDFDKQYDDEIEYTMRSSLFEQRRAAARAHNHDVAENGHTYRQGVNFFSDITADEMDRLYKGYKKITGAHGGSGFGGELLETEEDEDEDEEERRGGHDGEGDSVDCGSGKTKLCPDGKGDMGLPKSVDWREKLSGWTSSFGVPKNQGSCGSCWSFAATAAMEAHVFKSTGKTLDLSEQNLVSCTPNPRHCGGKGGCEGATSELAFEYIKGAGQTTEDADSYRAATTTCPSDVLEKGTVVTIEGYTTLTQNDYGELMEAVALHGPLTISVDAGHWNSYHSGIFNQGLKEDDKMDIDHAVLLVGYGEDESIKDENGNASKYWIVRNSWGPSWGENGHIRIARHDDDGERCWMDTTPCDGIACDGECETPVKVCGISGILYCSSYPTGVSVKA